MKKWDPPEDLQVPTAVVVQDKESLILKLCCSLVMALGLSVCVLTVTWKFWTTWVIEEDLRVYARVIRFSDCSPVDKELLLNEIESIQDRIASGTVTDFARWWRHDRDLRELLAKKNLQPNDVPLIERELRRAARLIHAPDPPPISTQ